MGTVGRKIVDTNVEDLVGSENKSMLTMLNPSDSIVDWVLETVPEIGAGWCPPGMLGIGVGGTADNWPWFLRKKR